MVQQFTGSEKIGEIVALFPASSRLFKQYRIDFCCGGNRTLSSALQQRDIGEQIFLEQLNQLCQHADKEKEHSIDWRQAPISGLISHIVQTHHGYLQTQLPALGEYVGKILRVHGKDHADLAQLHRLFHGLKTELEQHLIFEEEVVFPLLEEYEQTSSQEALAKAVQILGKLEGEHHVVGDALKYIRAITNDYQPPQGACRTFTLTYQQLAELEEDILMHVHLENNILFPRVSALCESCE